MQTDWKLRVAPEDDISAIEKLIPLSVRGLQAAYYSTAQMEAPSVLSLAWIDN